MSMFELTRILWRRRVLVLAIVLGVFVIGAVVVLVTRTTTYTASSQVLFDQPGLDVTEGGATVPSKITNLIPTFCRLVGSNQVAAAAAASSGVPEGAAASVSCSIETNTLVVLLEYTNARAETAQRVVASVSDQLVAAVQQRYDPPGLPSAELLTAQVIQASHARRNSHGTARALGLVGVGALILAAAFALAVEPHRRDWDPELLGEERTRSAHSG